MKNPAIVLPAATGVALVLVLLGAVLAGAGPRAEAQQPQHFAFVPGVARDGPLPTPTPRPVSIDRGRVVSMRIDSIGVTGRETIERRDTAIIGGREQFENPVDARAIAHYPRFGSPETGGGNFLFAAHVNYFTGVATPFARILQVKNGDDLFLTMEDGTVLRYTIKTVETIPLRDLSNGGMNAVVWPALASNRERVTLISCGGDFIPNPSGVGGSFTSRVIVTAERVIQQ